MSDPVTTIFLCGDVMTGRGIDQILPHPSEPRLYESYVLNAIGYVILAERASGEIPRPVDFRYPWGEALAVFRRIKPDLKIINLETSITTSEDYWRGKGINYRMHPDNAPCLTGAGIDACTLANNHVLDWGYQGLEETLTTLESCGITTAGAGRDLQQASAPARLTVPGKGRVLLYGFGVLSSGIPEDWCATPGKSGVNLLPDLSNATLKRIALEVQEVKQRGDTVIASIHWGGNWGYEIDKRERDFAHGLIDTAGVDIVHGHSSHHVKGIEVHRGRLIIYGCGDFINDYEGIQGYEMFRGDLGLMYFPKVDAATGELRELTMVPTRLRKLQVSPASKDETRWLREILNREGRHFGTAVELAAEGALELRWQQ